MDVVDRCLMDIMSVYRDVIALQIGAAGALVNEEIRSEVADLARRSTPEDNLRRIDAIFAAREQMMEFNTTPLMALESMMVTLRTSGRRPYSAAWLTSRPGAPSCRLALVRVLRAGRVQRVDVRPGSSRAVVSASPVEPADPGDDGRRARAVDVLRPGARLGACGGNQCARPPGAAGLRRT